MQSWPEGALCTAAVLGPQRDGLDHCRRCYRRCRRCLSPPPAPPLLPCSLAARHDWQPAGPGVGPRPVHLHRRPLPRPVQGAACAGWSGPGSGMPQPCCCVSCVNTRKEPLLFPSLPPSQILYGLLARFATTRRSGPLWAAVQPTLKQQLSFFEVAVPAECCRCCCCCHSDTLHTCPCSSPPALPPFPRPPFLSAVHLRPARHLHAHHDACPACGCHDCAHRQPGWAPPLRAQRGHLRAVRQSVESRLVQQRLCNTSTLESQWARVPKEGSCGGRGWLQAGASGR